MEAFDLSSRERGALERYTRDLTTAALRDELEPVRCRERETDQVVATLLRQSKNNPVLIGEAGVGKTAIVEGLAQRIVRREVPETLVHVRLHALSHLDLIAGTSFRGQFEKRLRGVIEEASADPQVVLFVDELHNLVGAGGALGQPVDAANLIKPALSRGELRVIGATTRDEYERYVLPDAALERRFHPVEVVALDREQTLEALRARRPRLEAHHALAITDAALEQAIAASDRPAPALRDRKQPDKAIDLVDQACALERLRRRQPLPEKVAALVSEREALLAEERAAMDLLLGLATARGTPLERFSFGTYRALEAMGLGLERLVTGQVTPRRALPTPDSVRRLEASDPAGRLTAAHRDRLLLEDRLRSALVEAGLVIDAATVAAVLGDASRAV